jgi:hypothetical protein
VERIDYSLESISPLDPLSSEPVSEEWVELVPCEPETELEVCSFEVLEFVVLEILGELPLCFFIFLPRRS